MVSIPYAEIDRNTSPAARRSGAFAPTRSSSRRRLQQGRQPRAQRRPRAALLVLEEHEGVAPPPADPPQGLEPGPQVVVRVAGRPQAQIAPVGGGYRRRGAVVVVGD